MGTADIPCMSTNDHNSDSMVACVPNTVASIMTRHVITVTMDNTLKVVRKLFDLHRVHHLPVLENGKLVGMVSDRDMLRELSPGVDKPTASAHDLATLEKHVHQIMKRGVLTATPLTPIADAGQIMLAHSVSALPVLDAEGRCVGIVSSRDFMKWCLQSGCPTAKAA